VTDFYARQKATHIPGVPKLDHRHGVDGQRKITILKPLPPTSAGRKFELRNKVIGVYDKGKPGTVIETEQSIVDKATGEVYSKVLSSGFLVGQGNWGGPKGNFKTTCPADEINTYKVYQAPLLSTSPLPRARPPMPCTLSRAAWKPRTYTGIDPFLTQLDQWLFNTQYTNSLISLNGDYNPLHATPEPGQKMGFGGIIIHGLFSWNSSAHGILRLLGGSDPANLKEFQARFASPVRPGDTLTTEIWRLGNAGADGFEEIRFVTKNQNGKAVLSNGRCLLKVTNPKSKL
jgi:acyl dehydratase